MKLDDWQQEILETKNKNILACTGRQIGKTMTFSLKAARRLIKQRNCKIIVVSLTEDQAQLIISMILTFLEKDNRKLICKGRKMPTKNIIRLNNGSIVRSRAVGITGNSVRGFTGDVLIVDEASRMPESVWTAAKPTLLTTAGEIWMCSTPHGKTGYFYQCFLNANNRFKVWHKASTDILPNRKISAEWTVEKRDAAIQFLDDEKKDMSRTRFGQEYEGLFIEDLQQFFPDKLIQRQMKVGRPQTIRQGKQYYLGVDLARMGKDQSTFEIIELRGDRLIHVENQVTTRTHLNQSTNHILELDKKYNFQKIFMDTAGIGVGVYDHLLEKDQVKAKLISIDNSKRALDKKGKKTTRLLKEDLYNNLLRLMEADQIDLLTDPNIFHSLKSVQYEYTSDTRGIPHLKIFGNDTHIVEGLHRAAQAIKYKSLNIWLRSFRP